MSCKKGSNHGFGTGSCNVVLLPQPLTLVAVIHNDFRPPRWLIFLFRYTMFGKFKILTSICAFSNIEKAKLGQHPIKAVSSTQVVPDTVSPLEGFETGDIWNMEKGV